MGALGAAISASSCSPSSFFGKGTDAQVIQATPYRRVNTACSEMQLSSSTLDVPTARRLLACFNSNGALEPVQQLFDQLSDDELEPLISLANRHILSDPAVLYQLERTVQDLAAQGILDESLTQLGRLLENEEFVAALVATLKDKYFSRQRNEILVALEQLSIHVTPAKVAIGLDAGLTLAETRAFNGLQTRFKGASPAGRGLREMTDSLLAYVGETGDPGHVEAGRELLRLVATTPLLEALDTVTGRTEKELRVGVPRASSFLKVALADNGRALDGLTSLFHHARKAPIACLGGSKQVPDGALFLMGEMALDPDQDASRFIQEKSLMTLVTMNPFCSYPPEMGRLYPVLMDLADTNAMQPGAELMRALYLIRDEKGARPAAEFLARLLSDTGSGGVAGIGEDRAGIKRVIPLLAELNDRGALDELLILASLPRIEDRGAIRDTAAELIRPLPALRGRSLYDVLSDSLVATSPKHFFELVYSLRRFVGSDEPMLAPALRTLRAAYYVNDAHPLISIVQEVLAESTRNARFFDTLIRISDQPEFRETIRLVSTMSRDGRMKELVQAVVTLFHRFALEGRSEIALTREPLFVPRRRHDLAAADLVPFKVIRTPSDGDPCRKLDLNLPMGDPGHPGYGEHLGHLLKCLNKRGRHQEWVDAVEYLRRTKMDDGRDLFSLQLDLVRSLDLGSEQMGWLADRWMSAYDDGSFERLLQAVPMWVTRPVASGAGIGGAPGEEVGPVLEPLIRLAKPVGQKALAQLRRLEDFGARVLRREDAPALLAYADKLLSLKPESLNPVETPDPQVYPVDRLASSVAAVECRSSAVASARVQEILDEYRNAVTGQDRPEGKPHFEWSFEELKAGIEPILDRLSWLDMRGPKGKRVYDALLGYMRYFALPAGERPDRSRHYAPEYLLQWLTERSVDFRPITYYYPGESFPRVRLVNSLDRLDLVLSNADFVAPVMGTNFGMKFLMEISDAWGDEPWEVWPKEIQDKFPGRDAKKLAAVVADIEATQSQFEGMVGFPVRPSCVTSPEVPSGGGWVPKMGAIKPKMYNIRQLLPVLRENAQNGGLRVLRDLFFELRYSTDSRYQDTDDERNNLYLVMRMIRLGVFRQLGRNLMIQAPEGAAQVALQDVFKGLIHGSIAPEMSQVAGLLVVGSPADPNHKLAWAMARQIFDGLGPRTAGGRNEEGRHLRQSGFYLLADGESLGLIQPVLKAMAAVLDTHGDYLTSRPEGIRTLLTSPIASRMARALYEDVDPAGKSRLVQVLQDALVDPQRGRDALTVLRAVDEDVEARRAWDLFVSRAAALADSEDYKRLRLEEWVRDSLDFIEEKSSDPRGVRAARRLRLWTAERLESRDFDALLVAAQKNPKEFYGLLTALGHSIENGEVRYLLDLARRSLK